jgi:hypothetical protein
MILIIISLLWTAFYQYIRANYYKKKYNKALKDRNDLMRRMISHLKKML